MNKEHHVRAKMVGKFVQCKQTANGHKIRLGCLENEMLSIHKKHHKHLNMIILDKERQFRPI